MRIAARVAVSTAAANPTTAAIKIALFIFTGFNAQKSFLNI